MQNDEAKIVLGFPPNSVPSQSQIKSAYRRKVWETHPDRFPPQLKAQADSNFKLLSEAYTLLNSSGGSRRRAPTASPYYSKVVRSGVPNSKGGRGSMRAASAPFLLIIFGALALGGSTASRAYQRQKEAHPCFNPFLP
ncbi:chaperone protein DnaJ [Salvia splendens]|uniref:chaperone protein DnaJ n=1 Tax=Salvia splendens TaxID=180675 RepID=UPI001C25C260|nr:chaperone protein DnaJ [Salvia splendens]